MLAMPTLSLLASALLTSGGLLSLGPAAELARPLPADALLGSGVLPGVDIDVTPAEGGYTVRGSLLLTEGFTGSSSQRREAALCDGCSWRITDYCPNTVDGDVINACIGTIPACPEGTVRMRVWRMRDGEPWQPWGAACIGPQGPVTVASVTTRLRSEVPVHLPASAVRSHPSVGLTRLPLWFADGIDGPRTVSVEVLGVVVEVWAEPVCTWHVAPEGEAWQSFGVATGCAALVGSSGGSGWSGRSPSSFKADAVHIFRRPGSHAVRLDVEWRARWWVPGEDHLPGQWVDGLVVQPPQLGTVLVRDGVGILRAP